ncbi:MAG: NADH-quinone oxidoreductase subunit J [Bdellovibrionota bacterium]
MVDFLSLESVCFFILSFTIILSSLISVLASDIKVALFSLFATFFGIAGLYAMLYSEFLAIMQVIVYVGAILILLLFAALLLSPKFLKGETSIGLKLSSFISVCVFFIIFFIPIISKSTWVGENRVIKKSDEILSSIGEFLLSYEFLTLEVAAVLILVALVGASIMIKEEK